MFYLVHCQDHKLRIFTHNSSGWSHVLGRIGVVAVVASLDIALSQWSFEYIDVALYTVTKSTSIVFILFFSLLFR